MYIVDSLGMCGNIRYRGINLSNFQCPLQLRFLIYEEMLNSSTCIVFLANCGCKLEKCTPCTEDTMYLVFYNFFAV